ncbi:hypothetical protein Rhow_000973 [Rhodococcus wratislaviensis]|uniref:Uncharacterized protein n=1 Tax=Rhodococcus wratislaviensis TaxID=44752 RepID=A0A402CNC6_RHOWR|nr:hypothetical protein Rhow_000973 [Rhodococcus wratislaviensis]
MGGERVAGDLAEAGHDVDGACGQSGLLEQRREVQDRQRRSSGGFTTRVFPAASAGAIFHAEIISGVFHGTIAPITPTGSRTVYEWVG